VEVLLRTKLFEEDVIPEQSKQTQWMGVTGMVGRKEKRDGFRYKRRNMPSPM